MIQGKNISCRLWACFGGTSEGLFFPTFPVLVRMSVVYPRKSVSYDPTIINDLRANALTNRIDPRYWFVVYDKVKTLIPFIYNGLSGPNQGAWGNHQSMVSFRFSKRTYHKMHYINNSVDRDYFLVITTNWGNPPPFIRIRGQMSAAYKDV